VGANFSQQSQRYCKEESFDYIIPELIENHPEHAKSYHNLMTQIQSLYNNMLADGIPAEDARFILPNACVTAFTVSYNLEALIHLANVRLCSRAQWEIRRLVKLMCEEVIKIEPWLAEYFVPKCKKDGHCKEINCCGLMPKESKTK
jgi:thymidylate synthase (FAD)